MDIKWIDDGDGTLSARVDSVILLVTPRDGDVWTAQIKIKYGIVDDATFASREDAVRWCVRRLPDIVDPLVATARAEAALAEREACAQWFDDRAASHERSATLVTGNPASFGGGSVAQGLAESLTTAGAQARLDARVIRARTAPAKASAARVEAPCNMSLSLREARIKSTI